MIKHEHKVGDVVTVAGGVLTDDFEARIVALTDYGYDVVDLVDEEEWVGPVSFELEILTDMG